MTDKENLRAAFWASRGATEIAFVVTIAAECAFLVTEQWDDWYRISTGLTAAEVPVATPAAGAFRRVVPCVAHNPELAADELLPNEPWSVEQE